MECPFFSFYLLGGIVRLVRRIYSFSFVLFCVMYWLVLCIYLLIDWLKEQAEAKQKKNERQKKDALQTIKSAIIISGIVVAVAGAAFAITKKLREKWPHLPKREIEDLKRLFMLVLFSGPFLLYIYELFPIILGSQISP